MLLLRTFVATYDHRNPAGRPQASRKSPALCFLPTLMASCKGHMVVCGCVWLPCRVFTSLPFLCVGAVCAENLTSDQALSSPSALGSPGMGIEGINRRRKKRTSIETNIRVALEKSFLEVR